MENECKPVQSLDEELRKIDERILQLGRDLALMRKLRGGVKPEDASDVTKCIRVRNCKECPYVRRVEYRGVSIHEIEYACTQTNRNVELKKIAKECPLDDYRKE